MIAPGALGRAFALLIGLALLAVACAGDNAGPGSVAAPVAAAETADSAATATAAPQPTSTTEPVTTATPARTPTESAVQTPLDTGERDWSEVTATVDSFVSERGLNGAGVIVVHRDDGVLYHEHFGEFDEDRISLIASSSKMISAGVLLKLQEEGLIDIDAPIADVVDWGAGNPDITTAQLLSNSSGLVGLGPDVLYAPYICQWLATDEIERCAARLFTDDADDADVVPPDTKFRYGGAQWQVAGAVAEAVSGRSWSALIDSIYVEPCDLDALGYLSLSSVTTGAPGYPATFAGDPGSFEPTENPTIEGGGYATTGDYGKLLLMHLRGGRCGDNQVLTQASLDLMHADRIAAAYDGSGFSSDSGYGMGWWIDRTSGQISDGGAYGSVPWLDLDDGYGVYVVIEDTAETGGQLAQAINGLVHEVVVGPAD